MAKLITIQLTKEEVLAVQDCFADAESEVQKGSENEDRYKSKDTYELFCSVMTKIYKSIPRPNSS